MVRTKSPIIVLVKFVLVKFVACIRALGVNIPKSSFVTVVVSVGIR